MTTDQKDPSDNSSVDQQAHAEVQFETPPNPEEIQTEIEKLFRDKFGGNVQFYNHSVEPPKKKAKKERTTKNTPKKEEFQFDYVPKDIKEYLDDFVIKQDEAKKALAIAVCDHYQRIKSVLSSSKSSSSSTYSKQNVLMLGPTGVGKTYLIKLVADLIGVPFVKADATRFTESGYVGANVDDLIRDLVNQADGDIERAQFGIVYLDEADKLASPSNSGGRDVSGRGVQFGLLKLMEESEVDLRSSQDFASQMQAMMEIQRTGELERKVVNTANILFIVSGAFSGLDDIIKKRVHQKTIGLSANIQSTDEAADYFPLVNTQDLIDFGFEPEFVGRLPVRVSCEHLTKHDLYEVLKESKGSIIHQYQEAFAAYEIQVEFANSGLKKIAELAALEKTGARALMTVLERVLRHYKFELPSTDVRRLQIDEDLVSTPKEVLQKILAAAGPSTDPVAESEFQKFLEGFVSKHGMTLKADRAAVRYGLQQAHSANISVESWLEQTLTGYEHGLNLIKQNTGQESFLITRETLESPHAVLETWIRDSYRKKRPQAPLKH